MTERSSNYRQIIKATSIFGGVQVFNIFVSLIRSKVIAFFLGPVGFGISGILTTTADFISALINAGISSSAVRYISLSSKDGDDAKIVESVSLIKQLVRVTGLLGLTLTIIISPLLSQMSFGSTEFAYSYVWLALSVFFQQITSGKLVVLQGLLKLKYLALANMLGATFGLLLGVPLYYFFGVKAIGPVIFISALTTFVCAKFYFKKLNLKQVDIPRGVLISRGKELINIGFFLSVSSLIAIGTSYVLRIYIGKIGGLSEVGLFTAGFAIINTYVGVVFQAMSTDYYPRLSAESNNIERSNIIVNRQSEVSLLIIGPILCFFIVFIKWIVIFIYSEKFIEICNMLYWAALGIYFKAPAWAMAFVFLTNGRTKFFFFNELISNLYMFFLNIFGYWYLGLEGLGISFLISYFIYFLQVHFVVRRVFGIVLNKEFVLISLVQFSLGISVFCLAQFSSEYFLHIMGLAIVFINSGFSIFILRNRLKLGSGE